MAYGWSELRADGPWMLRADGRSQMADGGSVFGAGLVQRALTLPWQNVDLAKRTVTVISAYAKNGKVRTVPLNTDVHEAFTRLPYLPDVEWVFTKPKGTPYTAVRVLISA